MPTVLFPYDAAVGMCDHYFLSYSRHDAAEFAPQLASALELGEPAHHLWLDRHGLRVGVADWDDQVDDAILACRGLLFIVSRDSVEKGSGCKPEWSLALGQGKPIIPVILHADAAIPSRLRNHPWVDFSNDFGEGIVRLRRDLDWLASSAGVLAQEHMRLAHAQRRRSQARPQEIAKVSQEIAALQASIARLGSAESTTRPTSSAGGNLRAITRTEPRPDASVTGVLVASGPTTPPPKTVHGWNIVFAASSSLVGGPASPIAQLLREIEPCLRYLDVHVHAAQNVLGAIVDCGLLRTLPLTRVHPLADQAMLAVGAGVVGLPFASLGGEFDAERILAPLGLDTDFDAVVYLVDPQDPTTRLAETLAVKRECIARGKAFLVTSASAREWFTLHALVDANEKAAGPSDYLRGVFLDVVDVERTGIAIPGPHAIALLAQHYRKHALVRYAVEHQALLNSFAVRISTETSARILNEVCQHGEPCPASLEEMEQLLDRVRDDYEQPTNAANARISPEWVAPMKSGTEGGDLQVAEAILTGLCDTVVFFEDPLAVHDRDIDPETVERAATAWNRPERRLAGRGVTLLSDPRSAGTWAQLWMAQGGSPTTLTAAFRARFGVEIVVADPSRGDDPKAAWSGVAEEGAWYLLAAVMAAAGSRWSGVHPMSGGARQLRLVVPPGRAMHEVIDCMRTLADAPGSAARRFNYDLDESLRSIARMVGGGPEAHRTMRLATALLRSKMLPMPLNVSVMSDVLVVAPATGSFGSPVRGIEANVHADELAAIFEAEAVSCAPTAFGAAPMTKASVSAHVRPYERHWEAADLVMLTCDAADEGYLSDRGEVPMPAGLGKEMREQGAVGHVAGLFIDRMGRPIDSAVYTRCGIRPERMRAVAWAARRGDANKDSVLIATQDISGRRLATIKAVLEGGYVSTLITDMSTARAVLKETEPKVRESTP